MDITSFPYTSSPYLAVHLEMVKPSIETLAFAAVVVVMADISQLFVKLHIDLHIT